jgi:hypothetical protein
MAANSDPVVVASPTPPAPKIYMASANTITIDPGSVPRAVAMLLAYTSIVLNPQLASCIINNHGSMIMLSSPILLQRSIDDDRLFINERCPPCHVRVVVIHIHSVPLSRCRQPDNLPIIRTYISTISVAARGIVGGAKPLAPIPPRLAQKKAKEQEKTTAVGDRARSSRSELSLTSPTSNAMAATIFAPPPLVAGGYAALLGIMEGNPEAHITSTPSQHHTNAGGNAGGLLLPMDIAQYLTEITG